MSHLHIPDGVLPLLVWAPGLVLATLLLLLSARPSAEGARRAMGYQSALGALLLAAMSVEIPLGPFEYHLSLIGPLGVLLGAVGGYQVVFVAVTILAFVGHGGFTVVGLNALVLGAGVALARPLFLLARRRLAPPVALATATGLAQGVSGLLWLAVIAVGMKLQPGLLAMAGGAARTGHDHGGRAMLFGAVALPLWALGIAIEATVAYGIGGFLARVRPDLLPGRAEDA
jgi:cobalt/nickel transport system permease protein